MHQLILFVAIVAIACFAVPAKAIIPPNQAAVFASFCSGAKPAIWLTDLKVNCSKPERVCDDAWPYVECDFPITTVVTLSMSAVGIAGPLPTNLGNLVDLTRLYLDANQISGAFPPSVSSLVKLSNLDVSNNSVTSMPDLSTLTLVTNLRVNLNQLTDWPAGLNGMTSLGYLDVSRNQINTVLPQGVSTLTRLGTLKFDNNRVPGPLPDALGMLTDLVSLYMNNNAITGEFPSNIGNLLKLVRIFGSNNWMYGTIPTSFTALTLLTQFDVGSPNRFCGCFPNYTTPKTFASCTLTNSSFCVAGPPPNSCPNTRPLRTDCTSCADLVGCYNSNPPPGPSAALLPSNIIVLPSVLPPPSPSLGTRLALSLALGAAALFAAF